VDLSHSHFSSLTVKNAIVDQFRESSGVRPSVDLDIPDLPLLLYLHRGSGTLYKIWSGEASMHKRGYRSSVIHKASLRETTAAALLLTSGWNPQEESLCDPMCGSGTIAIEAALIRADVAPGLIRYGNPSMEEPVPVSSRWPGVDPDLWSEIYAQASAHDRRKEMSKEKPFIFANDVLVSCIELAVLSAGKAKVHRMIGFTCKNISVYKPGVHLSTIVTNPPWDRRLDGNPNLKQFNPNLSQFDPNMLQFKPNMSQFNPEL
jgi:23S rRNA G2445 N2-methylase RlmL